jgi:hypothetical protein
MERKRGEKKIDHKIYEFLLCKAFRKRKIIVAQCIKYTTGYLSTCSCVWSVFVYTDKKKKKFLIYKEIQMGSGAKSYMRKGFLIYEEMRNLFPIYEEAVSHT